MAVLICPICKQEGYSWVRCPRYAAPVCMNHCNECRFFSGYATSIVHCFFGSKEKPAQKNKP